MKYIGENAIKKLISLIKGDLATKQPTITASGILKGDGSGTVTAANTQEATLVDVPNGLLKGDGTTISAAVAGTDYVEPSALDAKLSLTGGTMTGELDLSGSAEREITKLFWNSGIFNLFTGLGDNPPFKFSIDPLAGETTLSSGRVYGETGNYYGSSITLNQSGVTISGAGGSVDITNVRTPTADTDAATKKYVDDNAASPLSDTTITTVWNSVTV